MGTGEKTREENIPRSPRVGGGERICLKGLLSWCLKMQWETLTCSFHVIPSILEVAFSLVEKK